MPSNKLVSWGRHRSRLTWRPIFAWTLPSLGLLQGVDMSTYSLPYVRYAYSALEPAITGPIPELHDATYVGRTNDALDQFAEVREKTHSFGAFQIQLTTAPSSFQGSGWGVLTYEPAGRPLIGTDHDDGSVGIGSTPLFAFDARERAYYLQHRSVRHGYVQKLRSLVNCADPHRDAPSALTTTT